MSKSVSINLSLQVPFDDKGNMLDYTRYAYPDVAPKSNTYWGAVAVWRKNHIFQSNMKIESFERGRSAARYRLRDDHGHLYTMTAANLLAALQSGDCVKGYIRGNWAFVKRGANYSLVWV